MLSRETLTRLEPSERRRRLSALGAKKLAQLINPWNWKYWQQDYQRPPAGDWLCWLMRSGRGAGKSRAGAEWVRSRVAQGARRVSIMSPTFNMVRNDLLDGPSGLLNIFPPGSIEFHGSRQILRAGDATIRLFSAQNADRLRGSECDTLWLDEAAHYPDARAVWDQAVFTLRGRMPGDRPRAVVTSTPLPGELMRYLTEHEGVVETAVSTYANRANLAPEYIAELQARYEGTALGRQEIFGEIIWDVPGAVWRREWLFWGEIPPMHTMDDVVVAVDPSGGRAECGIVAAARRNRQFYILEDCSTSEVQSGRWAADVTAAAERWGASTIVAETNYGGQLVVDALGSVGCETPIWVATAERGKVPRARGVSLLYEQKRVSHRQSMPELEAQMTTWTPRDAKSPDRLDALVWALTYLRDRF